MPTKIEIGTYGLNVARMVKLTRAALRLRLVDVATRCADAGRPMTIDAIRTIENGTRRVDPDDLVALATALGLTVRSMITGGAVPLAWETDDQDRKARAAIKAIRAAEAAGVDLDLLLAQKEAEDLGARFDWAEAMRTDPGFRAMVAEWAAEDDGGK